MIENPIDPVKFPNCHSGYEYAIQIVEGEIPASVYTIGACQRFLKFYERANDETNYFLFEHRRAERYLKQVQFLKHVIGNWGTPKNRIIYSPWQKFLWMNIIGFRHKDDTANPLFRVAHAEFPRGQAKSTMASQCALYFVGLDTPLAGSQISCFATKADQARIVLDASRMMAKKSPDYLSATGVEVQAHKVIHEESFSFVRAMSSDSDSMDGLNDKLAIMDELHAMSRSLFEVVYSGLSKRRDSLMLCITTAGFNTDSVGHTQSTYAKKVAKGEVQDDQFFALIYTADENDDVFDELTWIKANPGWGVSVDPLSFRAKMMKAKHSPADLPGLKVKHLNLWLNQAYSYFHMPKFKACADRTMKFEDFHGKKCFAGIDLATVDDLCSQAYCFREDGIFHFFTRTYVAEEARKKHKRDIYVQAIAEGNLIEMPGEVIDLDQFEADFFANTKLVRVQQCLYDPHQATSMSQSLTKKGVEMVEFKQTLANFNEPTKKLYSLILEGKVRYNGSCLTEWCVSNVVTKPDADGKVRPLKENETKKIDEVIAMVQALAPWLQLPEEKAYESRGIRFI